MIPPGKIPLTPDQRRRLKRLRLWMDTVTMAPEPPFVEREAKRKAKKEQQLCPAT